MIDTSTTWFAEIVGDAFFVDDLPQFFPSGTSFAFKDDDRIWLKSDRFLAEMTAAQVHEEAERLLDEMAGALCVFLGHYLRPKIGTVYLQYPDGRRTGHHIWKIDGAVVRPKARAKLEGASGQTVPQQFVQAALQSSHLHTASLIWTDQVRTWPRIYRVMKEVQQHLGMVPYKAALCSQVEYRNFEHAANSAGVAGLDARYPLEKMEPAAAPMTLQQAEAFVGQVLERTFRHVVGAPNEV